MTYTIQRIKCLKKIHKQVSGMITNVVGRLVDLRLAPVEQRLLMIDTELTKHTRNLFTIDTNLSDNIGSLNRVCTMATQQLQYAYDRRAPPPANVVMPYLSDIEEVS